MQPIQHTGNQLMNSSNDGLSAGQSPRFGTRKHGKISGRNNSYKLHGIYILINGQQMYKISAEQANKKPKECQTSDHKSQFFLTVYIICCRKLTCLFFFHNPNTGFQEELPQPACSSSNRKRLASSPPPYPVRV